MSCEIKHRLVAVFFVAMGMLNQMSSSAQGQPPELTNSRPKRWLLLACGLPGDAQHQTRLTTACKQIVDSIDKIGVSKENLVVLCGDQTNHDSLSEQCPNINLCNGESLESAINEIGSKSKPHDSCWIILLGHADLYERSSRFNIAGPDVNQFDFAKLLEALQTREQVIWVTTPVSGFWVKPLSQPGRVVITATEADLEFTGTEMPYSLGATLANANGELHSVDDDDRLSLFDLYVCVCLHVADQFFNEQKLQTEHSQLDDNADGRGSELQSVYLTEKFERIAAKLSDANSEPEVKPESPTTPPRARQIGTDGYLSQQILLKP